MRPLIIVVLTILLVSSIIVFVRQQAYRTELDEQKKRLMDQLEELERESSNLKKQLDSVDSDTFIERVARDQLGMVRPGEIVFEAPDNGAER